MTNRDKLIKNQDQNKEKLSFCLFVPIAVRTFDVQCYSFLNITHARHNNDKFYTQNAALI